MIAFIEFYLGMMMKKFFTRSYLMACCAVLSMGYSHASFAMDYGLELEDEVVTEVPVEAIQKFVEVFSLVQKNYVQSVNDEQLFTNAMQGLLKGLDNYSRYLPAEDYKELVKYTEGELATVDFDLSYTPLQQQWLIENLKPDADSFKLGLRNGMPISKIGDKSLVGLNIDQVKELLTGQVGSKVTVQLGLQTKPIQLILNKKKSIDVQGQLMADGRVLVIRVPLFTQDTANDIKRIIEDFSGYPIQALMLDLRNNPGGLLSSAVETADLFLDQGLIVTTKSRAEGNQSFRAIAGKSLTQPLGVLINAKSASAAEVLTAALQQNRRAWVMGEKSYGKGVVQKVLPLNSGDAVSLTVADYYTPDGKQLEGAGIEPNLNFPLPADVNEREYLERLAQLLVTHYSR